MGLFSGFFNGFGEGVASAVDDIRHKVVEEPMYGQPTTGNIELPQVQAPPIEPAKTGIIDLTSPTLEPGWGVSAAAIEPPVEPVTWRQAVQDIEAPQIEAPSQQMER